jgi:rhamnopyranosyl-N-acetylglucosaminyl-diphospho-decaprenol beta-1,3/1,4-galactofuranosyltransferase
MPDGMGASAPKVCAVVVTYNRKELLVECLEALARQTLPLGRVIVVDNASTDGTLAAVAESEAAGALDLGYIAMADNVGDSGGFAEGIGEALSERQHEWLWILDDDAIPEPDALAAMLEAPQARAPGTAAMCAAMRSVSGHWQTEHRGHYRKGRPLPLVAREYERSAVEVDFAGYAGLLVRRDAAEAAGLPKSEFFIWVGDLEWCLRLRRRGAIWLIPGSAIVHKDENPQVPVGRFAPLSEIRRSLRRMSDTEIWRHVYCFRNMSWIRKTYDGERLPGFAWHLSWHWARVLLNDRRKLRRMRWYLEYGLAGRRGEFRNCPPRVWIEHASAPDGYAAVREASVPFSPGGKRLRGPFDPTDAATAGR